MSNLYPEYAACISDVGRRREKNEDDFYFEGLIRNDYIDKSYPLTYIAPIFNGFKKERIQFFSVFDGMGGGDYGEVASHTAAKLTKDILEKGSWLLPYDVSLSLNRLCETLNKEVFQTAVNLGTHKMGTTMSSLLFYQGYFWVCNVGDSKAFLIRNNQIYQISKDHTDAEEMKLNNITDRKPYVTQYLGIDPEETRIEPYIYSHRIEYHDKFLICSDGLTDMVPKETILKIICDEDDEAICAQQLLDAALEGGGIDNITIMVIQ